MEQLDGINWPDHYAPANCPIHVRNELGMDVPADRVWAWLIRAPLWPSWYPNSDNVELAGGIDDRSCRGAEILLEDLWGHHRFYRRGVRSG